jgi:hypothetical protein
MSDRYALMKKTFVPLAIFLIIGAGIYFFIAAGRNSELIEAQDTSAPSSGAIEMGTSALMLPSNVSVPKPASETTPTTVAAGDMRSYENTKFHFRLSFPKNLSVREFTEAGGELTVTLSDEATGEGFQIFATPYKSSQITTDRFRLDEPSGVYNSPVDVFVDGVRATMFFGSNTIMGDTREVWFIRKGYLYEVTTYKELDEWLGQIMQTWKFI